jgi:hypothetical protein
MGRDGRGEGMRKQVQLLESEIGVSVTPNLMFIIFIRQNFVFGGHKTVQVSISTSTEPLVRQRGWR